MFRELKNWICGMLVLAGVSSASAFSLLGPPDAEPTWQQIVIGYQEDGVELYYILDVGGPMNLGEEYRWNTPIVYYAFDANFLDYFGSSGVAAVESAVAVLNGVTNVSSYSSQLNEFPMDSTRFNFRASAMFLMDVKSQALSLMLEQLGLASSERWTWCLHDRSVFTPPPCPGDVSYEVIKRNFDPVTFEPSSYVNDTLFSYVIYERCQVIANINTLADALEFPVDPLSPSTPVAATSFNSLLRVGNLPGAFYTGLTRDDVGGLRYMWRTNNMNVESVDPTATLIGTSSTNGSTFQVITTLNLTSLSEAASTNNPAQLLALFPDLVINSVSSSFQVVVSSNFVSYFTNLPGSTVGSPATLVTTVVYTTNFQERFTYAFANVVTNPYFLNGVFTNRSAFTNARVTTVTTSVGFPTGSPVGSPPVTTVNTQTKTVSFINGDYFVIPPTACRFEVLSNLFSQVIPVSTTVTATSGGATNVAGQGFSQTTTYFYTNHFLVVRVTPCPTGTNTAALRQGMDRLTFVRRSYDSLLGQFFEPVTTNYTLRAVSASQLITETYRRTVNRPDFLFSAGDFAGLPGTAGLQFVPWNRNMPGYARGSSSLAGPGIIQSPTTLAFNKVGPIYFNSSPFFLDEASQSPLSLGWVWASYDGTTNPPVLYPNGASIQNLENQVLMQITPSSLPNGTNGVFYSVQLGVIGGQPPYTFSLATGSAGLPNGLVLTNVPSAAIVGTPAPAAAGHTFDFTIHLQDSSARQVDKSYSITISP